MRSSSYDIYPGNVQILSRYTNDKKTIPFEYGNQFETTTMDHPHYGLPRLMMTWQIGFTTTSRYGLSSIDEKDLILPQPNFTTIVETDIPDPKLPPIFYYLYWITKQASISNNVYTLQYTSQAGPPGDIYYNWVHCVIFNDSFDAPFEEYVEV